MRTPRHQRRSRHVREIRPAMRAGINATPIVLPDRDYASLTDWLRDRFGDDGVRALGSGDVFADYGRVLVNGEPYVPGERIWIFRPVPDEPSEPIELDVIFQNERFIVVDKPHGMATIPRGSHVAQTVTVAARRQFGNDQLVSAHRLDAETAGLVLLTTDPQWRGPYQLLFENRLVTKTYQAVAPWVAGYADWRRVELRLERGREPLITDVVPGEPNAVTDMRVVKTLGRDDAGRELALWDLAPHTGKTHQLRVTLNHIGAPIVGDPLYPTLMPHAEMACREHPLQLLAAGLSFIDPIDDQRMEFCSRQFLSAR